MCACKGDKEDWSWLLIPISALLEVLPLGNLGHLMTFPSFRFRISRFLPIGGWQVCKIAHPQTTVHQ